MLRMEMILDAHEEYDKMVENKNAFERMTANSVYVSKIIKFKKAGIISNEEFISIMDHVTIIDASFIH